MKGIKFVLYQIRFLINVTGILYYFHRIFIEHLLFIQYRKFLFQKFLYKFEGITQLLEDS